MGKQPTLVSIVLSPLTGDELCCLLRESSIWMVESAENTVALQEAAEKLDLSKLPGEVSSGPIDSEKGTLAWFSEVLEEIDMHHDGILWTEWEQVDVLGLPLSDEAKSIAEVYGSVHLSDRENCFAIINSGGHG